MSADFDWNAKDADSVVLQHQPRTAVYHSATGNVIVRQEGEYGDDDQLIYMTPQGALAVAWRLIEEADLVGLPQPSLSLMVESEHKPELKSSNAAAQSRQPGQPKPGPLLRVMEGGGDAVANEAVNPLLKGAA